MSADQLSFDDYRRHTGRGGPRAGAGRPRGRRSIVYHVRREQMPRDCPAHVTLRIREGLPSLRRLSFVKELRSFAAACERVHGPDGGRFLTGAEPGLRDYARADLALQLDVVQACPQ